MPISSNAILSLFRHKFPNHEFQTEEAEYLQEVIDVGLQEAFDIAQEYIMKAGNIQKQYEQYKKDHP